jgi:hypothetical protein
LHANVAIHVLTQIFLVVRIVADLGRRRREARLACSLRQVLILAIGRGDPLPPDELISALAFNGRASGCCEDSGGDNCKANAAVR